MILRLKGLLSILVTICMVTIIVISVVPIKAEIEGVRLEDGNFTFTTMDHKRSSNIYWSNIGFNISLKNNNGNPLSDKDRITIYYTDEGADHKVVSYDDKYNLTTFTISANLLRDKFNKKFKHIDEFYYEHHIATGATLYFNNIFRIYWGEDNIWKDKIMTLSAIKDPGFPGFDWSSNALSDFPNHFDKPYTYHADPILPTQVVYYLEGTEVPISKPLTLTPKSKEKWGKLGEDTYHTLASYKMSNGVRCKLVQSYYTSLVNPNKKKYKVKTLNDDESNLKDVKDQTDAKILDGGTLFVGILRPVGIPDTTTSLSEELLEPCPSGVIKADTRGNEEFNVEEGIPTSESLYVNAFTPGYLSGYQYTQVKGEKIYPVTVNKTWTLTWTTKEPNGKDKKGNTIYTESKHSKDETVTQVIMVRRKFSYYLLDYFDVYGIQSASFENYALPNESVTIQPKGYSPPSVTYKANEDESWHMKEPEIEVVELDHETKDGGSTCPVPDTENFSNDAEESVEKIKVRNDELIFNGKTLMEKSWEEEKTKEPMGIAYDLEDVNQDVLYQSSLVIDSSKSNGEFSSTGTVNYVRIKSLNSKFEEILSYEMTINDVTIHTPTVCDGKITDLKIYNQKVNPIEDRASLILDKEFTVRLETTGQHNNYKGYGYRDYDQYIATKKVKFPFDVYRGQSYISAGSWIAIQNEETFYLPTWVTEGSYEIEFEAAAINSEANNGYYNSEYLANLSIENYVATDSVYVQVTGRLYDLQIYDITDYPLWESVFRRTNSLALTGFNYTIGLNNQNGIVTGRKSKYTFPLVKGSHPSVENEGPLSLGYCTRFKLKTIGDMDKALDSIKIIPRFYYIDYQGGNRQEVDLYYTETFASKRRYLVKVGSEQDKLNKKTYLLGSNYWQVPIQEINNTAFVDGETIEEVRSRKSELFTFGQIELHSQFRTYIGGSKYIPSGVIPSGVKEQEVISSVQQWYGEYYLPSQIHVVPKDFNLGIYAVDKGSLDFTEDIWLRGGYIVINFDIVTYQTGSEKGNLSYINKENALKGYCNMWELEGVQLDKKDSVGNVFHFKYGDYILYDIEKSAASDYRSGGTH